MTDDQHRLTKRAKQHVTAEVRCPRKGHLLAVVVGTTDGPLVACRAPWVQHAPDGGWVVEWGMADQPCECPCARTLSGRMWYIETAWLLAQEGTVVATHVPKPTHERGPQVHDVEDDADNPFA